MNFLENIFAHLQAAADVPVLQEARGDRLLAATGNELASMIARARAFLRAAGLRKGDRCGLLAPNSIEWAALDLAIIAEGGIVVPLYSRQAASELVGMMQDCAPSLLLCADAALRDSIAREWSGGPRAVLAEEIFSGPAASAHQAPSSLADSDTVAIIYTSGTSGEPKGVMLTVGNLNHMLARTGGRLDQLMSGHGQRERVFHYLPFCFAGSWILLLSCLARNATLTLSTDLNKLTSELQLAAPEYFLNVPILLERMRAKIEEQIEQRGGPGGLLRGIYRSAKARWMADHGVLQASGGGFALWLARKMIFPAIRGRIGPNLRALICGSAALAKETQLFFMMLGIPVLQVYGLTETTAICTMDIPGRITPGRVGPAIDGIEMKVGETDEVLVRGQNIFAGYWNRPEATAQAMRDGWFHTGDQGAVDASGNWSITGRLKNLLILASGHNVAPEPIEEKLLLSIPGAQQVVLVGHGRKSLAALISGTVERVAVDAALAAANEAQPHYKRVHAYHIAAEPFSIENGLLTANGKLKRDVINERYRSAIEAMYQKEA